MPGDLCSQNLREGCLAISPTSIQIGGQAGGCVHPRESKRHGDRAVCDVKTWHLLPTPFRGFASRAVHTEVENESKGE